jgi:hypothetical protein
MDARSVGSRGSLYLNLRGNVEALKDAPEAIDVFSKGKGGGRDRQRRKQDEPKTPLGLQIDASQMESFGNASYGVDDLDQDDAGRSGDASYVSFDASADWDDPVFDDHLGDDDEGNGSVYGEFELKDDEMDLKPPASRKERSERGSSAVARLAHFEEDVRSVGSRSVKSSKSVHTNPGVLRNDRAPRAKKAAPQQKSAAERLSQFNTMARVRPASTPQTVPTLPTVPNVPSQVGAVHDIRNPLEAQYKQEFTSPDTAKRQSQVGAHHDTRNPLEVQYKQEFSPPGTAKQQSQVGAHPALSQNHISTTSAAVPIQRKTSPILQGGNVSTTNEETRPTKNRSSTFVPPPALQTRRSAPVPVSSVQPTGIVERRKFEDAKKNLQRSITQPVSNPPRQSSGLRASLPAQVQPRNPHLTESRLSQGSSPMPVNPRDIRYSTASPGGMVGLPQSSPAKAAKPSSSWGRSPLEPSPAGWASPLGGPSPATKKGKAKSKNPYLPSMAPLQMPPPLQGQPPATKKGKAKSKHSSLATMTPLEIPSPLQGPPSATKKGRAKIKSSSQGSMTPLELPSHSSPTKKGKNKAQDPKADDPPFSKPKRSNSNGSLGALFGGLRRSRNKDKK